MDGSYTWERAFPLVEEDPRIKALKSLGEKGVRGERMEVRIIMPQATGFVVLGRGGDGVWVIGVLGAEVQGLTGMGFRSFEASEFRGPRD